MKLTPKPWAVVAMSEGRFSIGRVEKPGCFPKSRIADIVAGSEGDARLISAAPELLAALMYLRECIEDGVDPAMSSTNEAIAKATGGKK
jgi:hypothetical protein